MCIITLLLPELAFKVVFKSLGPKFGRLEVFSSTLDESFSEKCYGRGLKLVKSPKLQNTDASFNYLNLKLTQIEVMSIKIKLVTLSGNQSCPGSNDLESDRISSEPHYWYNSVWLNSNNCYFNFYVNPLDSWSTIPYSCLPCRPSLAVGNSVAWFTDGLSDFISH